MPEYTFTGPSGWEFDSERLSTGDSVEASEAFVASFPQFFEEAEMDADAPPVADTAADSADTEPADNESTEADETEAPFDPSEQTIDELETRLEENDFSDAELDALADAESNGKDREGATDAIDEAR